MRKPKLSDFFYAARVLVNFHGGRYLCQSTPEGWRCGHCGELIEASCHHRCKGCGAVVFGIDRLVDWDRYRRALKDFRWYQACKADPSLTLVERP